MPLTGVNRIQVRPEKITLFEEEVGELSQRAAETEDRFHWTGHQAQWGVPNHFAFVYEAENFAAIEELGSVRELWERIYPSEMKERFGRANECVQSIEQIILVDRPELSHPPHDVSPSAYPYAVVTQARCRAGHAEACEELIRKLAEAIPKVGDSAHLLTYENHFGTLGEYWIVRPLKQLSQLDEQLMGAELLERAFGPAEGGLLWRSGTEAVEFAQRELLMYRPELSNPA